MKYVLMYSKLSSSDFLLARELLEARGIPYAEVDVTDDEDAVAGIFIGDLPIGGYRELAQLDADGSLRQLLR